MLRVHQPGEVIDGVAKGPAHFDADQWYNPFMYTYVGVALTPSMFAIGWFMKTRVAFLVNLGTIVGWFFLVPLAVAFNVPVYEGQLGASVPLQDLPAALYASCSASCD
ncbi:MAG: hypothetical protein ACJZ6A_00475 [Candidatus Poseidoniaceae archaeon]